ARSRARRCRDPAAAGCHRSPRTGRHGPGESGAHRTPWHVASGLTRRLDRLSGVGRVVVDVMPKPEILDPQGSAVAGALARLGFTEFAAARQGKRFELVVDGAVTDD